MSDWFRTDDDALGSRCRNLAAALAESSCATPISDARSMAGSKSFRTDPNWRDLVPFHEYFHGDNGSGVGASHQTGWTGLVAKLMQQSGEHGAKAQTAAIGKNQ